MNETSFSADQHPRKLNLGSGFDKRGGYVNVDIDAYHAPDLVCDVTDLSVLPDLYYTEIQAMDILEHISRLQCTTTLQEWNRVLAMGGVLELKVPNAISLLRQLEEPANQTPAAHHGIIQSLLGTQHQDGDFHLNTFTELTLLEQLESTGFGDIELSEIDDWMIHARAIKREHVCRDPLLLMEDNEAFIRAAFEKILHRGPDPDGLNYYLNKLGNNTPREVVLDALQADPESQYLPAVDEYLQLLSIDSEQDFVIALYEQVLERPADGPGIDWYMSLLNKGSTRKALLQRVVASNEYRGNQSQAPV